MCGRLFSKPLPEWRDIMNTLGLPGMVLPELHNQAPSEQLPFIFMERGRMTMRMMRWGLHPKFAPQPPTTTTTTQNARIENLQVLPTFREAIQRQRGFVPAAGFVEWRTVGKIVEPFFFDCPEQPLAIAGVWDVWNGEVYSFSVITQPADKAFGEIHPRMPLTLNAEQLKLWQDPRRNARDVLQKLHGSTLPLRHRLIDFGVNNTKNKAPVVFVDNAPSQAALF